MLYIINDRIAFRAEDGALYLIESNDGIVLPIPAQRLLLVILESNGEILRRDFLLHEVWDKFGLTGSNNNLNQYLSLLRRSLSAFGCEDFIETIPKIGIKTSDRIQIKIVNNEYTSSENASIFSEPFMPVRASRKRIKPTVAQIWILFFSLLLISSALIALINNMSDIESSEFDYTLNGNCRLVVFSNLTNHQLLNVKKEVERYLNENEKTCNSGVTIFYDSISSQSPYDGTRKLFTYCENDNNDVNVVCVNTFIAEEVKYD